MKLFSTSRRRFLKSAGSASLVAGVASAGLSSSTQPAHAYDPGADERRARYQPDAPDVQAFYRTNGYETLKKK